MCVQSVEFVSTSIESRVLDYIQTHSENVPHSNICHKSALYIGIVNIKTDKTPFVVQMHPVPLYKRLEELCRNEKLCINFPL